MAEWDCDRPWYHGSQERIMILCIGSSITPNPVVARAFSHRPSLVSQSESGRVQHDGTRPGYLYVVAEGVQTKDVYPHPHPVNAHHWEWLTTRELHVEVLEQTDVREDERLTDADIAELRRKQVTTGHTSFIEENGNAE